ncbi:MAG TPA: hypothetical protein VLM91_09530 [Candidatus Methylomirabilis sp.]|nr:hypothetical protein [Candidatus Methylomirabilis sp.]
MKHRVLKKVHSLTAIFLVLAQLWLAGGVGAQTAPPQNPSPFDMTGLIQTATLDPTCAADPLCGGTITVNDQVITVPKNTILQMPALALTWQQVFAQAPAAYKALNQSGLALSDGNLATGGTVPPPLGTYEVHVQGNRVGDSYIAGLLFLAQSSLQSDQGFINNINYATGEFEVGGIIGVPGTGQRVRLNDPAGRFGLAPDPTLVDPRFTIDENNPTVRSATGYPMCIPRGAATGDSLCPETNRPPDPTSPSGYLMTFTFPAVANVAAGGPDPRFMAPFEVGDFVTYSGILVADPTTTPPSTYIAAYQVIGNVGLFTAPGDVLAYVATDVMLLGTGGANVVGLAEATVRTRFEGFTTDPTRNILLFGVDVDACTGANPNPLRSWGAIGVDPGAPGGAVQGRWRFRPPCTATSEVGVTDKACLGPAAGTFLPPTREMRASIETVKGSGIAATPVLTGNGLNAGQYQAPIFEFLFPENAGVGTPVVPNNFETFPFLAQGSGPLDGVGGTGPAVGQLTPWPGLPVPTAVTCAVAGVPLANAGPNQTVASGAVVTLQGSATGGTPPYTFAWTAPAGVTLTQNATTGTATFTAPLVSAGAAQTLTFSLVVTDSANVASAPAAVTITVNPVVSDTVSIGLVQYRISKQRLVVNASSSAAPTAILTAQAFDVNGVAQGPAQTMIFSGGVYVLDILGVPQPATVKVVSDHGGSAVSGITQLRQ